MLDGMSRALVLTLLVCLFLGLTACGSSGGATSGDYFESEDGDLSGNRLSPTKVGLVTGVTKLSGTTADGDLDYFTITVPENGVLSEVVLSAYNSFDNGAFIAVVEGDIFSVENEGDQTDAGALLGYALFGPEELNEDLLPVMATGGRAGGEPQGFTLPLEAGDYSFWIQQTALTTDYTLEFRLELAQ